MIADGLSQDEVTDMMRNALERQLDEAASALSSAIVASVGQDLEQAFPGAASVFLARGFDEDAPRVVEVRMAGGRAVAFDDALSSPQQAAAVRRIQDGFARIHRLGGDEALYAVAPSAEADPLGQEIFDDCASFLFRVEA